MKNKVLEEIKYKKHNKKYNIKKYITKQNKIHDKIYNENSIKKYKIVNYKRVDNKTKYIYKKIRYEEQFLFSRGFRGKNVALIYPNSYYIGSSNLGFQTIFKILDTFNLTVNRYFIEKNEIFSPDSEVLLNKYEYIYISISYENDFFNLINILKLSHIALFSENRKNQKIIIGGAAVSINPFLYALIGDYIFLGEAEVINDFESFFEKSIESKKLLGDAIEPVFNKRGFVYKNINKLISNNYFEFASNRDKLNSNNYSINKNNYKIYNKNSYKEVYNYNGYSFGYSYYLTRNTVFSKYFLIEITRGCLFNCHFCNYSTISHPYRIMDIDKVIQLINYAKKYTNNIGLISAILPEYDYLKKIINSNKDLNYHFSSLRVDKIDRDFFELISDFHLNSITIAPESGSDEVRKKIGKNFTNNQIIELIKFSITKNINKFKFYFILGLHDNDEEYIIDFFRLIKNEIKKNIHIVISVNPLIPKPMAILGKNKYMSSNIYESKIKRLKSNLYKLGKIKLEFLSYKEGFIQYVLSNYCLSLKPLIKNYYENGNLSKFIKKSSEIIKMIK